MALYTIEFCCTGNRGRSTVAEVIGNWYLQGRNLEVKINVISSGTEVEKHSRTDLSIERAIELMGWSLEFLASPVGQEYGKVLSPQEVKEMEHAVTNQNTYLGLYKQDPKLVELEKLRTLAIKGREMLRRKESDFRNRALGEVLPYFCPDLIGAPKQMVANPETSLVLGMEQKHVGTANEIYIACPSTKIATLPGYCHYPSIEIPDLIRSTDINMYRANVETLRWMVPSAIDIFMQDPKQTKA